MTTQTELDEDLLAVLEQHLATRRDLLKDIRKKLLAQQWDSDHGCAVVTVEDIESVMDKFLAAAELPNGD